MGNFLKPVCNTCKKDYADLKEGESYSFLQKLINPAGGTYFFPCLDFDKNEITFADYNDSEVKENKLIVFYDDRSMFHVKKDAESRIETTKNKPVLPDGKFFCPNCREFDLRFDVVGEWE
jgi:hypothetical protein